MVIFKLGNLLYRFFYPLYKILYFFYKARSDSKKIGLLKSKIKPGMTVIDIGANIGFYTILFSKLVGDTGKVYAFEPDNSNFRHLSKNTKQLKNVVLNQYAVGEENCKIKLYYSKDLNVDHHTYDCGENRDCYEIECISIDNYFKDVAKIDFIKIDIQGFDYAAVRGMKGSVKKNDNIMIFGEFWPYGLNKAGFKPEDYLNFLSNDLVFDLEIFDVTDGIDFNEKINMKNYYTEYFGIKKG